MHWKLQFNKGKLFLSQKKLHKALKCFESAVTECPVSSKMGLGNSLFYLGLTLKRLGRIDSALRCWRLAHKLDDEGQSLDMIKKHSNSYGMSKHTSNIQDDKAAFLGIQLEKYLKMKKVKRFCSDAEKDVVQDIITNYWQNMLIEGQFSQLAVESKLRFFKNQMLIFPLADLSYFNNDTQVIFADFAGGKVLLMDDLCSCGSGIAFSQCCGRIKSSEELEIGEF